MDAAMDGYIRDLALHKWREVDDLLDTAGLKLADAVDSAGSFLERLPYHGLWERAWRSELKGRGRLTRDNLMERIEGAIRAALTEERRLRIDEGVATIEDTRHYQAFVERAMGRLLEEAGGEIEADMDEEEAW